MQQPSLGIFWIDGNNVRSFSVPLEKAEHEGGYGNYAHGHAQMWPFIQRVHSHLRNWSYEEIPRGRVVYVVKTETFHLLVPTRFLTDKTLHDELMRRYQLPPDRVVVLADEHYDPPSEGPEGD